MFGIRSRRLFCLLALLAAPPAVADTILPVEAAQSLALTLRDGKPMLAAEVAGTPGVMMLDIGTPYPVMLNRDALDLPPGVEAGRGFAASGQEIVVHLHPAPAVRIGGRALTLPVELPSGNFGFTRDGLGADFLGFLGLPAVADRVFTLDLGRGSLTFHAAPPKVAGARAAVALSPPGRGLPAWTGRIGARTVAIEIDTGDGGTLYLTEAAEAALVASGLLAPSAEERRLAGLAFGGGSFGPLTVRIVRAGGSEDLRELPDGDLLRLGARFRATHPTLWDLRAGRITVLPAAQAAQGELRP